MRKSWVESRTIRFFILHWGAFVLGILIALLFGTTQSQWRYVALAGFCLSLINCFVLISSTFEFQEEIQKRYLQGNGGEKRFLIALFYFARVPFLLIGSVVLFATISYEEVVIDDLVEVRGQILTIELYGTQSNSKTPRSLKIIFANNSNEYESQTFKIPFNNLDRISNELQKGDNIFVLVEKDDVDKVNDLYIQIYGIRTEDKSYLSLHESNRAASVNNFIGLFLGFVIAIPGLIYMLIGRIETDPLIST